MIYYFYHKKISDIFREGLYSVIYKYGLYQDCYLRNDCLEISLLFCLTLEEGQTNKNHSRN